LTKAVPYKIHTVLTDNGIQFTKREGTEAYWSALRRSVGVLRFISFDLRQPADAVQAAMQGRACQVRDAWPQGIQAIVQRQQRVFAKGHNRSFFLFSQNR
jgi:hypothetical protein